MHYNVRPKLVIPKIRLLGSLHRERHRKRRKTQTEPDQSYQHEIFQDLSVRLQHDNEEFKRFIHSDVLAIKAQVVTDFAALPEKTLLSSENYSLDETPRENYFLVKAVVSIAAFTREVFSGRAAKSVYLMMRRGARWSESEERLKMDLERSLRTSHPASYSQFESVFMTSLEANAPLKTKLAAANNKPRIIRELRKAIMVRTSLKKIANKSGSTEDTRKHKDLRYLVVKLNIRKKTGVFRIHSIKNHGE